MSVDLQFLRSGPLTASFGIAITSEGNPLDATEYARLFVGLARRGVGRSQIGINSALGKRPASRASTHEQELYIFLDGPVANGCNVHSFVVQRAKNTTRPSWLRSRITGCNSFGDGHSEFLQQFL